MGGVEPPGACGHVLCPHQQLAVVRRAGRLLLLLADKPGIPHEWERWTCQRPPRAVGRTATHLPAAAALLAEAG